MYHYDGCTCTECRLTRLEEAHEKLQEEYARLRNLIEEAGEEEGQFVCIEIAPHAFIDAFMSFEDGEPGKCAFPLCHLPPEEHTCYKHDYEEHPYRPGFCSVCGRAKDSFYHGRE